MLETVHLAWDSETQPAFPGGFIRPELQQQWKLNSLPTQTVTVSGLHDRLMRPWSPKSRLGIHVVESW